MFRTQVYLTEDERKRLRERAKRLGRSQSELLREAVDQYLDRDSDSETRKAFEDVIGMWKDRSDLDDLYDNLRKASKKRLKELWGE
ncbi:MAG: CopG family transcriptional regulator [Deltaproteobacteria bacterium]|nr:CopG family transcriptional regulator [Deltaproteobacteria bacterium]